MPVHIRTNLLDAATRENLSWCGVRLDRCSGEVGTTIGESADCAFCWEQLSKHAPEEADRLWASRQETIEAWDSPHKHPYRIPTEFMARIRDRLYSEHDGATLRIVGVEKFNELWQKLNDCVTSEREHVELNKEQAIHLLVWEELWGFETDASQKARNPAPYFEFWAQFDAYHLP